MSATGCAVLSVKELGGYLTRLTNSRRKASRKWQPPNRAAGPDSELKLLRPQYPNRSWRSLPKPNWNSWMTPTISERSLGDNPCKTLFCRGSFFILVCFFNLAKLEYKHEYFWQTLKKYNFIFGFS